MLIAGVIEPSLNNRPAPNMRHQRRMRVPRFLYSCSRPYSAKSPPSPSFWARRTKAAYLIVTMSVMVQITSDRPPSTASGVGAGLVGPKNNRFSA
jgi:hypothetical protein